MQIYRWAAIRGSQLARSEARSAALSVIMLKDVGPGFTPGRPSLIALPNRKKIRLSPPRYLGANSYFLTLCTYRRTSLFRQANLVAQCLTLLKECADRCLFDIWAYAFMPDHLHLLVAGRQEGSNLLVFMRAFKQRSGFFLRAQQRLWQKNYYEHSLRAGESWEPVARYIWVNPVRKGLCRAPEEWPFSGSLILDWRRFLAPGSDWVPPWKAARPGMKPGPTSASN